MSSKQPGEEHLYQGRQPGVPLTAPPALPIAEDSLKDLVGFLESCRQVLLVTGAGVSTESGTPDYRGPNGAYSTGYKPMTHQQVGVCKVNIDACEGHLV